jgi:hypothetical protein
MPTLTAEFSFTHNGQPQISIFRPEITPTPGMRLATEDGQRATILAVQRMQKGTGTPGDNWVITLTLPLPANTPLLATPATRPETGPLAFGTDWPGVFIRGDNALAYTLALDEAIAQDPDNLQLQSLRNTLASCQSPAPTAVTLRPFEDCLP